MKSLLKIMFHKNHIILLFLVLLFGCSQNSSPVSTEGGTHSDTTDIGNKGIHIVWDSSTLTKVSGATSSAGYSGYARMAQLQDGSLICVYEAGGNIVAVKSYDKGRTWSDTVTIAAEEPGIKMSTPDILELADGSLLVMYNPRPLKPYKPSKRFAIRTKKSYDGGTTWTDGRLLYQCGYRPRSGCWEPSAVQLPSGEIQLFFSNESIYTSSNEQNISLLRSKDGGQTWTKKPEIVSFLPGSRDGMPVPLVLPESNVVVVTIENNSGANFKPYTIRSSFKNNWSTTIGRNSPYRDYALAQKLNSSVYAGAPYLVQLNSGETLLSYQGTEFRQPNSVGGAVMRVAIGNKEARNFKHISTPFDIPSNSNGLWNSLAVTNDGTIIALTSTNAYANNGHVEIWMIKGHVKQN